MRQIYDCLLGVCTMSVTCGSMAVVCCGVLCHIHEAHLWVLAEGRAVVYSVSYMREADGRLQRAMCTLSFTSRRMAVVCCGVLCHLHEADLRVFAGGRAVVYSVSYMRQVGGCMQMGGVHTVSYIRQVGGCPRGVRELYQLLREGWRLSAGGV